MARGKNADPRREEALDRTVLELKALDPEGNAARAASLRGQALTLALELYDDGTEWFLQLLLELLDRFDASQGEQFSHYFKFVLSRRRNDRFRDVANRVEQLDSLDQPSGAGRQDTLGDAQAAPAADDPARLLDLRAPFLEWTAMVLNFAERHQGQAANETRRNWYRIFYTEDLTQAVKIAPLDFLHQRDVFVRGRVKDQLRTVGLKDPFQLPEVADRQDLHKQGQSIPVFSPQLLLNFVDAVLVYIQQHNPRRRHSGDLTAQLAADGAASAGYQHASSSDEALHLRLIQQNRLPAQQVVNVHIPKPSGDTLPNLL